MRSFLKTSLVAIVFSSFTAFAAPGIPGDPTRPESKYDKVRIFLRDLAAQYPQNAKVISIGDSDSGQPIEALEIGNGPVKNLVVATHHGNEYGSTEVAKAFAQSVAQNPILGQTMVVVPVLNISGYNANRRYEADKKGSFRDPNRDYPGPCGSEGPFTLKSTAALASFLEKQGIVATATLHTYYPAVVYPWGFSTKDLSTHYDDLFKSLVEAATVESKYETGNSTDVVYAADGTYEDYSFWKTGAWSILFEVGTSHSPSQSAVNEMIRVNVPGIRRMMEQAPRERGERHSFDGKCLSRKAFDPHEE